MHPSEPSAPYGAPGNTPSSPAPGGYPNQPTYPNQASYPTPGQAGTGYPPQNGSGYPGQTGTAYPPPAYPGPQQPSGLRSLTGSACSSWWSPCGLCRCPSWT